MNKIALGLSAEFRAELAKQRKKVPDFALAIGISEATAYRWINSNDHDWSLEKAQLASEWLGIPLTSLLARVA